MRGFWSYRSAILLLFLVLMTGTVVAVIVNSFYISEDTARNLSGRIVNEVGEKIVTRASGLMRTVEAHLLSNAAVATATELIPGQTVLYNMFWQQVVFTPELDSMYIGDSAGNFVQARRSPRFATRVIDRTKTPPEERWIYRDKDYAALARVARDVEFDPRERPWYQGTKRVREIRWSDVYLYKTSGKPGVTATYPVFDDQEQIRAVLGADIGLLSLSEFLSQQEVGRHSTVIVIDGNGHVIGHPNQLDLKPRAEGEIGLMKVSDIGIPWVEDAYAAIQGADAERAGDLDYFLSVTDGENYISRVFDLDPTRGIPWKLLIVVGEVDLLSVAYRALSESVVLSTIILIIALFIVYLIAQHFSHPVTQLARNTRLIRDFRFGDLRQVHSGFTEIREMNNAIGGIKEAMGVLESQLSTDVARHVVSGSGSVDLEAREMEVPVISSAVHNLGLLFDNMAAEDFTGHLRTQVERGSNIVKREQGTMDTFNGDRLFAFWGAPAPVENASYHACRAAVAMSHCFDTDDDRAARQAGLERHVGLHTGKALVGNVGIEGGIRFSVVGRPFDVAVRLRELNKVYGTRIIVSEQAHDEAGDEFVWRMLDIVKIDPDSSGFLIYELVAEVSETIAASKRELIHHYELGLGAYRDRKWAQALRSFEAALEHGPDDAATQLLIARCKRFRSGRGGGRGQEDARDGSVRPLEPSAV